MMPTIERFMRRVNQNGPIPADPSLGRCWLWTGNANQKNFYGKLVSNGRHVQAHRMSYMLHVGPIPAGLLACHHCDNPACVNPRHLFLGTNSDNQRDAFKKGRHCPPRLPRDGERNGCAKLTWAKVREIRSRIATGESHRVIASAYGVSPAAIWMIATGRTWTTTPDPFHALAAGSPSR